jgi:hypothetical protein
MVRGEEGDGCGVNANGWKGWCQNERVVSGVPRKATNIAGWAASGGPVRSSKMREKQRFCYLRHLRVYRTYARRWV